MSGRHLFVVSDVHGHLDDLVRELSRADLVDASGAWSGGDAQLWVLGDLTDRGPDGIGVVELVMSLQEQAPDHVHVLMGNHEALTLGMKRFGNSRFRDSWTINGGLRSDQEALSPAHVAWLASLPVLGRVGDYLLMHSDTTAYLSWGDSVEQVNDVVRSVFASDDAGAHWEVWARLTSRYHFSGGDGAEVAGAMLATFGGRSIVHGHSIIGSLIDVPSPEVEGPVRYAEGLVLAIDGGRYDGGPLLVVQLS